MENKGDESPLPETSINQIINMLYFKIGIQQSKLLEYEKIIENNKIEIYNLKKELNELKNRK